MKSIASLIVVADVAVVAYVEKVLMTPQVVHGHLVHTAPKALILTGLIFALPALLILLVAALRGRGSSTPPASTPRPGYGYGSLGGRR